MLDKICHREVHNRKHVVESQPVALGGGEEHRVHEIHVVGGHCDSWASCYPAGRWHSLCAVEGR